MSTDQEGSPPTQDRREYFKEYQRNKYAENREEILRRRREAKWATQTPTPARQPGAAVKKQKSPPKRRERDVFSNITPLVTSLWKNARARAKAKGVPFTILPEDIVVPPVCPVFGNAFKVGDGYACDDSPSLDRVQPGRGYVAGNLAVISHRANRIKGDASLNELKQLVQWLEGRLRRG